MKEESVLLQVNILDKMILRKVIQSCNQCRPPFTPTQMQIMDYLLLNQNNIILQRDLEKVLGLRRATVSGVLQTMEKHGIITRQVSRGDARVKEIIFNKNSMPIFLDDKEKYGKLEKIVLEGINKEEIEKFIIIIKKMQDNIINFENNNKL